VRALVALLLLTAVADAMVPAVVPAVSGVPLGFQQLTPAAATALTVPAGATLAVIVSAASFTWRDDGVAPTTTVGMVWPATVPLYYNGTLSAIQVINAAGTVNVSYYK
jgi:hypothetical protein